MCYDNTEFYRSNDKCKWRPTPATFADLNGRFAEPFVPA